MALTKGITNDPTLVMHLETHLDTHPDAHLDTHPGMHLDMHLDKHLDKHLDRPLDMHLEMHPNMHLDTHLDMHLDTHLDTHLHTHLEEVTSRSRPWRILYAQKNISISSKQQPQSRAHRTSIETQQHASYDWSLTPWNPKTPLPSERLREVWVNVITEYRSRQQRE